MKIEQATKKDFAEMMEFMLRCYRTVDPKHDRFEALYPDLYQPTDESMGQNFLVRESGKIASMAGLFPLEVQIGELHLKVGGVGGVCTDPKLRGKGYMTAIMTRIRDEIVAQGLPVAWLTGERDRYAHFGWEKAGSDVVIQIHKPRMQDVLPWQITALDATKDPIDRIIAARGKLALRGLCDDETLRAKLKRLHMQVLEGMLGPAYAYVVVNRKEKWLAEWGGDPQGVAALACRAAVELGSLSIRLPPVHDAYTDVLLSLAQQFGGPMENLAVFDLRVLLKAYKRHIAEFCPEGKAVDLIIEGGPSKDAHISSGRLTRKGEGGAVKISLPPPKMASFLFGPLRPSVLLDLPPEARWLDQVFPLPFYLPSLWRV